MGRIFGISDLPVSTIESALKPVKFEPLERPFIYTNRLQDNLDKFVSKEKPIESNSFVKMRNGIGRLMSHLSKAKPKA